MRPLFAALLVGVLALPSLAAEKRIEGWQQPALEADER